MPTSGNTRGNCSNKITSILVEVVVIYNNNNYFYLPLLKEGVRRKGDSSRDPVNSTIETLSQGVEQIIFVPFPGLSLLRIGSTLRQEKAIISRMVDLQSECR